MKPKKIKLTITLKDDQLRCFRLWKRHYEVKSDIRAIGELLENSLKDFRGSNIGNPALPELEDLEL